MSRGACELPINKITIKMISVRIKDLTVLPFTKIKDSSIKPPSKKQYQTNFFFLTKRWKTKENRTRRNGILKKILEVVEVEKRYNISQSL